MIDYQGGRMHLFLAYSTTKLCKLIDFLSRRCRNCRK